MTLILKLLRCPDHVMPETRRIEPGELVLGRGPGADWVLPDPAAPPRLSRRHCLLSFGADGWTLTDTSKNGTLLNGDPVPRDRPTRGLRDGDRLELGPYEIEIALAGPWLGDGPARAMPWDAAAAPGRAGPDGHGGWDSPPPAARLAPAGADMFRQLYGEEPPPRAAPDAAPHITPDITPAAAPDAAPDVTPDWRNSVELPAPAPAPAPARPPAAAAAGADAMLAAFLAGAALPDAALPDAAAALHAAGAAFRAFVHGVRRVLMARIEVKSAFRIDQTSLGARANPLKFAADDDDALAALLGAGRRRGAAGAAAVDEALDDLRRHELAVMAALRSAIRDLLARLEPGRFRSAAEGAGVLPLQRRARAFELYEAEFRSLADSLSDKFDDAFGRAFARAYEQVEAELKSREPRR